MVGVHAPIALAMQASPTLATAHAAVTVVATIWVLASARTASPVVCVAAYVAGSEVLWRQTGAAIPWEASKYLLFVIFLVGFVRFVGRLERGAIVALFVAMLLPASVIPIAKLGVQGALDPLAFNLAGLFALAMGVLFLSRIAAPWSSVGLVAWAFVAPVVAVAANSAMAVRGLGAADFFNDSNFRASGGFGPNQVSATLGCGALLLILVAVREPRASLRIAAVVLTLWFTAQALLTFSRGGLLNLVVALLVATPFLLRRRETATRLPAILLVVALLGVLFILPRLDTMTGGALNTRFTDTRETDRRSDLIKADFKTFTEHPIMGVGVGQAEQYRLQRLVIASHTEYTRLLAEHGALGILALACLGNMVVAAFRRQRSSFGRAWSAALVAWTLTELWHASTRLAAVPLLFALATLTIVDDEPAPVTDGET